MNLKLIKNIMYLLLMQGVSYLIPLVTLPYLTRILGLHDYGALSTAITFIQYAVLFVDFGFNFSATKKIADHRDDFELISLVFWETIYAKMLLALIVIIIFSSIIYFTPQFNGLSILFVVMIPQILGSVFFPVWYFQGVEKLSVISVVTMISKLSSIPLLLLFVHSASDIVMAAIVTSLPLFFTSLISLVFIYQGRLIKKPSFIELNVLNAIKDSVPLFLGTMAISLYILSTPLILGLVSTFEQVGLFVASDKLRTAMIGVFLILGQAIYPRVNALLCDNTNSYWRFIKVLLVLQLLLCSGAFLFFYFLIPIIAPLLLGNGFDGLTDILRIMSPMIILVPTSVILANFILLPHGQKKVYALIPAMTAVLHVLYSFIFCFYFGAFGGALSILLTEILSLSLLLYFCYKNHYLHKVLA